MANVVFKRGSAVEISAVPVTDGYTMWDTTNNIMYMGNGTRRLVFGVMALTAFYPLAYVLPEELNLIRGGRRFRRPSPFEKLWR